MKKFLSYIKNKFSSKEDTEEDMNEANDEEYVELEHGKDDNSNRKIIVRPYLLEEFEDIKQVLDDLRDGYTICLINIRPLKDKDLVELKRAINKLKKTTDAINGEIAGFGDDFIVVTPSFATIYKSKPGPSSVPESKSGNRASRDEDFR